MKILKSVLTGILCLGIISSCTGKSIRELIPDLEDLKWSKGTSAEDDSEDSSYLPTDAEVSLDEDDKALIAWVIACEVGDRPYKAQVCLAAVILNRIADDGFSEDARGVIFESGDFTSVTKGMVTGGVSKTEKQTARYNVARRALEEALLHDPTGGALYFGYSADSASHTVGSYECGGMVFGR